ncbi:unnamed protein product [Alternaria alternata]
MNANTDTDGLLKALQKLDETGRGIFVEYLPTDKIKDVLLLLLRERDAMPVLQNQSLPHISQATRPLFLQQPLAYAPLAIHPVSAREPVNTTKKRSSSTAISNDSKRARNDATVAQNANQGAAQILVKEEENIIEITSDTEHAEAETNVRAKAEDLREPADLAVYLRIPNLSGPDTLLKDVNNLPIPVRTELERRFKEMRLTTKKRAKRYAKLTHNPARGVERRCCIHSRHNEPVSDQYSQGGEPRKTADDACIQNRRPCAYFATHEDKYIIYLVPLPEGLRKSTDWTQIDYWVKPLCTAVQDYVEGFEEPRKTPYYLRLQKRI